MLPNLSPITNPKKAPMKQKIKFIKNKFMILSSNVDVDWNEIANETRKETLETDKTLANKVAKRSSLINLSMKYIAVNSTAIWNIT